MILYFIENCERVTLADVQAMGLGHAFDENPTCCQVSSGPGGSRGVVFACQSRLRYQPERPADANPQHPEPPPVEMAIKYLAGEQHWVEADQTPWPGVRFGWYTDHPPTPDALLRSETIGGYRLPLADGCEWLLPQVCDVDPAAEQLKPICRLPSSLKMKADRRLVPDQPLERVRWLWDLSEPVWQAMVADQNVDDDGLVEYVGKLLTANYYVSDVEAAAIGVFGDTTFGRPSTIAALCLGYEAYLAWKAAHDTPGKSPSATTGPGTSSGGTAA